jgi:predicted aspartyl protease
MNRYWLRFLRLALPCVLAACEPNPNHGLFSTNDHLPCHLVRVAELPYSAGADYLLVDAHIDSKPASFILDSGSFQTILTPKAAQHFALERYHRQGVVIEGIGGGRGSSVYRAHQLQLGMLQSETWQFLVADVGPAGWNGRFDGLLGADVLRQFDVDLDIPEQKILLYRAEHDCSVPSAFLHGNLFQIPLVNAFSEYANELSPRINVVIDGVTLVGLLDTGAPDNILFSNGAAKLGLSPQKMASEPHTRTGGIGPRLVPSVRHIIRSISLGDLEIANLPVEVIGAPDSSADMLLGLDIVKRVHLWISHSSGTLIMQYPPAPSPPLDAPASSHT